MTGVWHREDAIQHNQQLAISDPDDFVFGQAPRPVCCGRGVQIGGGRVIPEINFTLPPMEINPQTWPDVRRQYAEIIESVCARAVALDVAELLVEFETLPPMTIHPEWGVEITRLLADTLDVYHEKYGLRSALRLTPNDCRDQERPPRMRSGPYWDSMMHLFHAAAEAGADLVAIESTGGKEVCDPGLMTADLWRVVYALGVLAPRDMQFLWHEIVSACRTTGIVPSGDTACGFANTAMALAEQRLLPRVFAAVVRVASVPRTWIACAMGAVGPSKDCAYEGPYMKAIAGVPISMEGRAAACAHLSPLGNIAQAVCDCWSNESVQNVRLLGASAPVVSLEQLAYDCRLLNVAARSREHALLLRDWLVASDASLDPQAFVLRPDVVLQIAGEVVAEEDPYRQVRRAVRATLTMLRAAYRAGEVRIPPNEVRWLDRMERDADRLPDTEAAFCEAMHASLQDVSYLPEEYGLDA